MHTHQWVVSDYLLLSLPTLDGFSERLTSWACQVPGCAVFCEITGQVKHGYPLMTPPFWDAAEAHTRRRHDRRIR